MKHITQYIYIYLKHLYLYVAWLRYLHIYIYRLIHAVVSLMMRHPNTNLTMIRLKTVNQRF